MKLDTHRNIYITHDTLTCNNYNTYLVELVKQTIIETCGLNDAIEQRDRKHVEFPLSTELQVRIIPEEIEISNDFQGKAIKVQHRLISV